MEGRLHLYAAIDRTTKFAFVRLELKANMATAPTFLDALVEAVPYRIHAVLIDNGVQFADLPTRIAADRRRACEGVRSTAPVTALSAD